MPNIMNINNKRMIMTIVIVSLSLLLLLTPSMQQQLAIAQESGYNLTVFVSGHPFGKASVYVSVKTENGYGKTVRVSTAGGSTATFFIPPNQGSTVRVCVSAGILSSDNCQMYAATGGDFSVSMRAP
jgi:hypothetical protein